MIHAYGLLIGIGVVLAYVLAERAAKKVSIEKALQDSSTWIFFFGILGARLYHLCTEWTLYKDASLVQIIAVWNGGIGLYGALFGGICGLLLYCVRTRQTQLPFFLLADILAISAPLAQSIGRFGNYVNQELLGILTDLPWGIEKDGQRYHPLFLYEAIATLCLFVLLQTLWRKKLLTPGKGQYFSLYLALYAGIRFWLEFLRLETVPAFFGISVAQLVSVVVLVGGVVVLLVPRQAPKTQWEVRKFL